LKIFLPDSKGGLSVRPFPVIRGRVFHHESFNEIDIIFDEVTTVQAVLERSFPVPFLQIPVELHDARLDRWILTLWYHPPAGASFWEHV
jgi:hypothetical protein